MSQSVQIFSLPTGLAPIGIDVIGNRGPAREDRRVFVVVANSEEDSVSIFEILSTLLVQPRGKIEGIPRPYGVSSCTGGRAVITSPTQNRITIIQLPEATILGTLQVGARPYSVGCFTMEARRIAAVSNFGDSTLTLVKPGMCPAAPDGAAFRYFKPLPARNSSPGLPARKPIKLRWWT